MRLAEEADIAEITVQQIADAANVGRATFYLHYRNKNEIAGELFDALFDELTTASQSFVKVATNSGQGLDRAGPNNQAQVVNLFELLERRRALYRRIFRTGAGISFADRLQAFHEAAFLRLWQEGGLQESPGSPPAAFRAGYVAGGVRAVISLWLEQPDLSLMDLFGTWTQDVTVHFLTIRIISPPGIGTSEVEE
jgi:AcrR family transcriptional regulator